jgi:hypothetical protein
VTPGASRGMPGSLHQRLQDSIPTRGFLGAAWEVVLAGAAYRVFKSTLQGFESIDCRPLTVI